MSSEDERAPASTVVHDNTRSQRFRARPPRRPQPCAALVTSLLALGRVAALDAGLPVEVSPASRSTGAAAPACRRCCTPPCRCRPAPATSSSRAASESMSSAELLRHRMRWGARRRRRAPRPPGPRPGSPPAAATTRARAECWRRPRTCAASTASAARSRTSWPCARTSGRSPRRRRALRRRDRAGHGAGRKGADGRRHRRASSRRHDARDLARLRPVMGARRPGGDRHGRQRQRPERRRGRLPRHHPGTGGRARPAPAGPAGVLGGRRGARPRRWASARCPPPAARWSGPGSTLNDMDLIELNEAFAAQALAVIREWGLGDEGPRADQRQWLRHLPGPPGRRDRRPHPRHAAARAAPPRRPGTAWRPCASAAARAWRRSSSG